MLGQYRYQAANLIQHGPNHADFPEFLAFETSSAHSMAKLGHVQKLGENSIGATEVHFAKASQ
jgi:hypothetical protein